MKIKGTISFELRELSILITRYIDKVMMDRGLKGVQGLQAWTLGYLYANISKDIFQKDIEEKLSIRRSTASNLISRMEDNGYVIRESVDYDARLKKVTLTELGIEIIDDVKNLANDLENRLTKGMTEDEVNKFLETIETIKKNIEE